jgi:hypothetical protein
MKWKKMRKKSSYKFVLVKKLDSPKIVAEMDDIENDGNG